MQTMKDQGSQNKRIAKNTLLLYTRQIFVLFVSLYTFRLIITTLGTIDYGIYNVIAGVVSMFSFLSGTMSTATQRFFSIALGEKNEKKLYSTFTVNLVVYVLIAIVAFVLLETIGDWFVSEHLSVPNNRIQATQWIYHFSVLTFIATIATTPFIGIIIAHEDMHIYAILSIIEVLTRLILVLLISTIPGDKLKLYSLFTFFVTVSQFLLYVIYCTLKYKECQFKHLFWDFKLLKEIIGFTTWTLFGQLAMIIRIQATTILLNQIFNPLIVAARAISINVTNRIYVFSKNFNIGLYPSIIKSYATGNFNEMYNLVFSGSKIAFFLMWIFSLPLLLEMKFILTIWLKTPPPAAILFTRLALIEVLINSISLPIATAAIAPGKMKRFELTLGSINISIFIVSFIILTQGAPPYSVFLVAIIANLIMFIVRLLIVRKLISLPISPFLQKVILPILGVILVSFSLSFLFSFWGERAFTEKMLFNIASIIISILITSISIYFIGFDKEMRRKTTQLFFSKLSNIKKNLI